jgi:phenylalanyl-tRNA synthetase alpha subunit
MNQKVIVIGVLGIASIGAYVYFSSKFKADKTKLVDNSKSLISVPPKGTVLSSPEEVADVAKKNADAKALAKKIQELNKEKESYKAKISSSTSADVNGLNYEYSKKIEEIDLQISDFRKFINNLGFEEVNGNIVKIV